MKAQSWRNRRLKLIERAMFRLAALNAAGVNLRTAARRVAREFNGRDLGSGHPLPCSTSTVIRWFYRWRFSQKNIRALDYMPKGRFVSKVGPTVMNGLVQFIVDCGLPVARAFSVAGGKRKLKMSLGTVYRHLGPDLVRLIRQNHEQLMQQRSLQTALYEAVAARNRVKWALRPEGCGE
ncbi:MAG TPA: hypothetical protein P5567_07545 [Kiritimatiellia bacterium]|nr:hypothetical protein [Kiritimatiellia bacterium]HSA17949.1 hypothetical protein [Kiritimatiellia bacterium]